MNEEIKALIERETKEYSERIKKNTNFNSNERIAATAAFNRGANIISEAITNLFRWRKVSEDHFSKVEKVLIKVMCYFPNGHKCIRYTTGVIFNQERHSLDDDFIEKIASHHEIIEWMPIPEGGSK